jgi:hypothetical protein
VNNDERSNNSIPRRGRLGSISNSNSRFLDRREQAPSLDRAMVRPASCIVERRVENEWREVLVAASFGGVGPTTGRQHSPSRGELPAQVPQRGLGQRKTGWPVVAVSTTTYVEGRRKATTTTTTTAVAVAAA